jgi:hypothetical protein
MCMIDNNIMSEQYTQKRIYSHPNSVPCPFLYRRLHAIPAASLIYGFELQIVPSLLLVFFNLIHLLFIHTYHVLFLLFVLSSVFLSVSSIMFFSVFPTIQILFSPYYKLDPYGPFHSFTGRKKDCC